MLLLLLEELRPALDRLANVVRRNLPGGFASLGHRPRARPEYHADEQTGNRRAQPRRGATR